MAGGSQKIDEVQAQAMLDAMGGRVLVRGFEPGLAFSSISDAPNALEILNKNPFRGKGPADEKGHRDQSVYLAERKATDNWVREQGGIKDADRENPVFYAVVQDPKQLMDMLNNTPSTHNNMIIPLAAADPPKWTYTVGDSMGNLYAVKGEKGLKQNPENFFLQDINPELGKVKNQSQLEAAMDKYPTTAKGESRTFEAQYWGPAFDPDKMGGVVFSGGKQIKNTAEVTIGADARRQHEQQMQKPAHAAGAAAKNLKSSLKHG